MLARFDREPMHLDYICGPQPSFKLSLLSSVDLAREQRPGVVGSPGLGNLGNARVTPRAGPMHVTKNSRSPVAAFFAVLSSTLASVPRHFDV